MADPSDDPYRCPTCRASQAPASQCRRCKSDLRLYRAAWNERRRGRLHVLRCLREGRYLPAVKAAQRYWARSQAPDAARLLAVANLLAGRYAQALAVYRSAETA